VGIELHKRSEAVWETGGDTDRWEGRLEGVGNGRGDLKVWEMGGETWRCGK